jgi:hypothetical protein
VRGFDPTNPATPARKWLMQLARDGLPESPGVNEVIYALAAEPMQAMDYICWVEAWLRYFQQRDKRKSMESAVIEYRNRSDKNSTHGISMKQDIELSQPTVARILRRAKQS